MHLESLMFLSINDAIDIITPTIMYFEEEFNNNINNQELQTKINRILLSLKENDIIPNTIQISRQIDEILPNYFNYNNLVNPNYQEIVDKISQDNSAAFEVNNSYFSATIEENTNVDSLGVIFLSKFLLVYDKFIFNFLRVNFTQGTQFSKFCKLSNIMRKIAKYPIEIVSVLFEILQGIANTIDKSKIQEYLHYLFFTIPCGITYHNIPSEWIESFNKAACRVQFKTALEKYNSSNLPYDECIKQATRSIILIDLPKIITAITLNTRKIVIKNFSRNKNQKGATFFAYLHELSNWLRRLSCLTVNEYNRSIYTENSLAIPITSSMKEEKQFTEEKKLKNEEEKDDISQKTTEVGDQFEYQVFGKLYYVIRTQACEYLFEDRDIDPLEFKKEFKKKNRSTQDSIDTILRMDSGMTPLGTCGFQILEKLSYSLPLISSIKRS